MKTLFFSTLALLVPLVTAQDPTKPLQDRIKAAKDEGAAVLVDSVSKDGSGHAYLKSLEGNWDLGVKHWEAPNTEPNTLQCVEESKLVSNGNWLLSRVRAAPGSPIPFEGLAVSGWDVEKKCISSVWIESMSPMPARSSGNFDAKTNTYTGVGELSTPVGMVPTREVCDSKGDTRISKMFAKGADGKEFLALELTATRRKEAVPAPANADKGGKIEGMPDPKDPMHSHLKAFTGTWEGSVKMVFPGAPPMPESKITQVDTLICGDMWLHSKVNGQFDGQPFEGHGLMGYDPRTKEYVSFWFDSMSPHLTTSKGTCDKDAKAFALKGNGFGPDGQPTSTEDTTKIEGADKKSMVMTSKTKDGKDAGSMTIQYVRKK